MKTFRYLITISIVAMLGCFGCKTNVAPPEITFGDAPVASVKTGDTKEIAVVVKTGDKLKRVSFFCKDTSGEEEIFGTPVVKFANKSKYESVVTVSDINKCIVFVVEAVDSKDQTSRAEYSIVIDSAAVAAAAVTPAAASASAAPKHGGDKPVACYDVNGGKVW